MILLIFFIVYSLFFVFFFFFFFFDDELVAGREHPIRVELDAQTEEPAPYLHVRVNLEALIHRNLFYQLVELAVPHEIDGQSWLGVWSSGEFFPIGLEP